MKVTVGRKKKKSADSAIILLLCGLFLTPIYVREILISSTLYKINLVAFVGALLIMTHYFRDGFTKLYVRDKLLAASGIVLFIILALSEFHAGRTLAGFIRVFIGLLVPLIVLWYQPKNIERTFDVVVKALTVVAIIAVVFGLLHTLAGTDFVAQYYQAAGDENYYSMASKTDRLYSFWGHPLYNAQLYLSLIGLNFINDEVFLHQHKKDMFIIPICVAGVALTASKAAIVICLLMLVLLYIKNWKYMILFIILIFAMANNGLFDLVISRFSGSLSTGRNEIWESLQSTGIDFFHFFWGNGSDSKYTYESVQSWARAAFEYPYRLFALEFGILFDIIIMGITFVRPIIDIIKTKPFKMYLLIIFAAVSAHVNIYNGIGTYSDQMYAFCLFGCLVLSAGRYLNEQENKSTMLLTEEF